MKKTKTENLIKDDLDLSSSDGETDNESYNDTEKFIFCRSIL